MVTLTYISKPSLSLYGQGLQTLTLRLGLLGAENMAFPRVFFATATAIDKITIFITGMVTISMLTIATIFLQLSWRL